MPGRIRRGPDPASAPWRTAARLAVALASLASLVAHVSLLAPAAALAHPLGNFTINHYAGIRVSASEIRLDVVLDRAEIPTFQEVLRLDTDGDGVVSAREADAAREAECRSLASSLALTVDGAVPLVRLAAAGLSFPDGVGGLVTMRLVCGLVATLPEADATRTVVFADRSFLGRAGWREIVVEGDGVTVIGEGLLAASPSARLTAYPDAGGGGLLSMGDARFEVLPGGPPLPPFTPPDAWPLDEPPMAAADGGGPAAPASATGAPPRGLDAIPAIFEATDLSPGILLAALVAALALGAGHALTPGHGKALVAAYLVGTRGTAAHATGLGLVVTVAHTLGILVLALIVASAGWALPAEVVSRQLPAVAALLVVGIGAWMVAREVGGLRRAPGGDRSRRPRHRHADPDSRPHGHPHTGGAGGASPITWRSLFALGLAGGIVPSTSALLILLGTIAAGRPAFGVLLVVAFGVGMAGVLVGVGIALVLARDRLERASSALRLDPLLAWAPLAAASLVLGIGLWLWVQAVVGPPAL